MDLKEKIIKEINDLILANYIMRTKNYNKYYKIKYDKLLKEK